MARRSRIDIIGDMLSSIREKNGKLKPTHLMYRSNLSHGQMKGYLEELLDKELVQRVISNNYEYVILTDKGYEFLAELHEMKQFEEAFGLG
jgi:predicted transcriptional regulator